MSYQLSFLLCSITSFAQIISGITIGENDAIPIPFANILVEGSSIGTVSNEDGNFELSLIALSDDFTLIVSAIGYQTTQLPSSKIEDQSILVIQLQKRTLELPEVIITYLSATEIVNRFHNNYSTNYVTHSTHTNAFYHSSLSENGEHKHLLEATVNIREFNRKNKRFFEVELTQRRKSNDYRIERWNERNNYLYDAIASNPMLELSDFLDPKNQKHFHIKRLPNTNYNDQVIYVLKFSPKTGVAKPLYSARAYFNAGDFALIKAEYEFSNDELKIKNQSLKNKTYHIPYVSGSVQYQKIGDSYKQKYLRYNSGWTVINNVSNDTLAIDVLRDEILFLETQNDDNTLLSNPLTKWGDIYKKPFHYDDEYWNSQVKIPPSKSFQKAIEDLSKHQNIEIQYFNNSAKSDFFENFDNTIGGNIDSILSVYHATKLFNGVALVSSNNQIIHHKAYGYRDIENNERLDTATIFDIGSITKQFTTAIILKLREEGKLNLDDKIWKYLPNYRYANEITIHQLLAHRTGIPTFENQEKMHHTKWFNTKVDIQEMVTSYCSDDLEFEPDTQMEYSNSNFIILTAIIEEIERKDYFAVLDQYILQPLQLTNSYRPDSLPTQNVAKGYVLEGKHYTLEPQWEKSNVKGGGCIYSNATDLLNWVNTIQSTSLLNAADVALIQSPISYYDYYESDFGYSWAINKDLFNANESIYFYGGTSLGFYSMITTVPENGITIILLSNKGNFPRLELTNEILKLLE